LPNSIGVSIIFDEHERISPEYYIM